MLIFGTHQNDMTLATSVQSVSARSWQAAISAFEYNTIYATSKHNDSKTMHEAGRQPFSIL